MSFDSKCSKLRKTVSIIKVSNKAIHDHLIKSSKAFQTDFEARSYTKLREIQNDTEHSTKLKVKTENELVQKCILVLKN